MFDILHTTTYRPTIDDATAFLDDVGAGPVPEASLGYRHARVAVNERTDRFEMELYEHTPATRWGYVAPNTVLGFEPDHTVEGYLPTDYDVEEVLERDDSVIASFLSPYCEA